MAAWLPSLADRWLRFNLTVALVQRWGMLLRGAPLACLTGSTAVGLRLQNVGPETYKESSRISVVHLRDSEAFSFDLLHQKQCVNLALLSYRAEGQSLNVFSF